MPITLCFYCWILLTSKVPTLQAGYFASEMNIRKSLGGVVRSMWYIVVIMCRGRHWSNCQRELVYRHTSQRLWNSWPALRPYAVTFKWLSFTRFHHEAEHYGDELDRISGEKTRQLNPRLPRLPVGAGEGHIPKDSNAAIRDRATRKRMEGADRQTNRFSAHYSKICVLVSNIYVYVMLYFS